MKDRQQYIFRGGEIFLLENSTLPEEIPADLTDQVVDSFDLDLAGKPSTAVLLKDLPKGMTAPVPEKGLWVRMRQVFGSENPADQALVAPASRALGLVNWHHATRYCTRCGSPLVDHDHELARHCTGCGNLIFPRISPAIIVLVSKGNTVLLARHAARNQDTYACLAGFLEHGETLEQCVAREVREETGIEIKNIRYVGSQSWPFPDQFMLAFRAEWASGEINVDPKEIAEAKWFDRDNLPNTPPRGAVAWNLIHGTFESSSKK